MSLDQDKKRLTDSIAKGLAETVYGSYGRPEKLDDNGLLRTADLLFPHYPPTDEERNAAVVLREWLAASDVAERTRKPLEELAEAVELPARAYRDAVQYAHDMSYERRERWGHCEMRPRDVYKDLSRRLAQGDPDAIFELMAMARGEGPFTASPPPVWLPPELVSRIIEETQRAKDELTPLASKAAQARQCLSEYVWRIVKAEGIEPVTD